MAPVDRETVGEPNGFTVDAGGKRLVAGGGVVKTVADDHRARGERGFDDLMHELGTGRLVEQKLAGIAHLGVGGIEQEGANRLGDGGAARLA